MTHRQWLESLNLRFPIGGRKQNTLVWIADDLIYRPKRGDTGMRLQPKHLRGNVFPALYKALKVEVERINEKWLGKEPVAGTDTVKWAEEMRVLCARCRWSRSFIEKGGLSTVMAEADEAEARVGRGLGQTHLAAQAQKDDAAIEELAQRIGCGAYAFHARRLVEDVMQIVRADTSARAPTAPIAPTAPTAPPRSPDTLSRRENVPLERAVGSRS